MSTNDKRNDRNWHNDGDPMNSGPGTNDDVSRHGRSSEYGANFRDQHQNSDYGQRFGSQRYVNESRYGNGSERYGNERSSNERSPYWQEDGGWYGAGPHQQGRGGGQQRHSTPQRHTQQPNQDWRASYGPSAMPDYDLSNYTGSYGPARHSGIDQHAYGQDDWAPGSRHSGHPETVMQKVGRFFGVGPKGHKRSDERIREDVNDALTDDYHVDATHIEVLVTDGEVTLEGYVVDRSSKRHAEDVVASCRGVKDVHNRLKLQPLSQATVEAARDGTVANGAPTKPRQTVS